jgi:hypothetical protein
MHLHFPFTDFFLGEENDCTSDLQASQLTTEEVDFTRREEKEHRLQFTKKLERAKSH